MDKTRKNAETSLKEMPVSVTGARMNEMLIGITNVTRDAVIKIKTVNIQPYKKALDEIRIYEDLWREFIKKLGAIDFFNNLTERGREEWLRENENDKEMDIAEFPNSEIEIIQIGKSDIINKVENEDIDKLLENPSKIWKTMDIRKLFRGKPGSRAKRQTLYFLRNYWRIHVGYEMVEQYRGTIINVSDGVVYREAEGKILLINLHNEKYGFIIPQNINQYGENEVWEIVYKLLPGYNRRDVEKIKQATKNFTAAAYKSLLQKIIRFKSSNIALNDGTIYSSDFVLLIVSGLLALNPGSFVPDIQRYVTGMESFCKRLVITIFEDSYIGPNNYPLILSLFSSALLVQRVKGWKPNLLMLEKWFKLAMEAYSEKNIFKYSTETVIEPFIANERVNVLELASIFLDELKSFKGDLIMVRSIAKNGGEMIETRKRPIPDIMPIFHCVDQHWAPDIAYFFDINKIRAYKSLKKEVFSLLFENIFKRVTGINSRIHTINENDEFVIETKKAQKLLLLCKQEKALVLNNIGDDNYSFNFNINQEWFAGLIGPILINMRPATFVTLNPTNLTEMIAVRVPSREMVNPRLTDQQETEAFNRAKEILTKGVKLNSATAPAPDFNNVLFQATYDENDNVEYYINKNNTYYKLEDFNNFTVEIPYNQLVEINFENGLKYQGNGMVINALTFLNHLIETSNLKVLRRVLNFITGYHDEISLNEIGRDGGGTKNAIFFEDIEVYNFLLKLSLIYPAVLQRKPFSLIKFDIPLPPLLWTLIEYIKENVNKHEKTTSEKWGELYDRKKRQLWKHQRDSYNEMVARFNQEKKGNFLWIPVGLGKTLIVLTFLQILKTYNKLPKYVIYTLPDSALLSIQEEILSFGFNLIHLNPTKIKRLPEIQQYNKSSTQPDEYVITLIEHDHLRLCRDSLVDIMPNAFFIIDEVHKTLNDTLRTSVALELANLSNNFIALTGTPVIDNKIYKLVNWISLISNFQVNEKNFWVAINSMIAKNIHTGVTVYEEYIEAHFTPQQQKQYRSLVSPNLGGTNQSASVHDFNLAINLCYDAATLEIVNQTFIELDKGNGVMLVARNQSHQDDLYRLLVSRGLASNLIFLIKRGHSLYLTDENVAAGAVPDYRVVITSINYSSGYTLTRFHVLISSIYPSNNATRQQLLGRINRISQSNPFVIYRYIHLGILSHILKNHQSANNLNEILKTLAQDIVSF